MTSDFLFFMILPTVGVMVGAVICYINYSHERKIKKIKTEEENTDMPLTMDEKLGEIDLNLYIAKKKMLENFALLKARGVSFTKEEEAMIERVSRSKYRC